MSEETGYPPPEPAPRIVKPRKLKSQHLPLIVVTRDEVLIERTGQVCTSQELSAILVTEPSSIIVGQGFGFHLERLIAAFSDSPDFQYRIGPRYRDSHRVNGEDGPRVQIIDACLAFVGWPGHYHYPLDPVHYLRDNLTDDLATLLDFGKRVRSFCEAVGLKVKPSAGGLAAQLLHDPRFYPEARRKVPRLINDLARERLPGNYYHLYGEDNRYYSATYLDMENAHHYLAQRVRFPCANTLHMYGRWNRANPHRAPWATRDSPQYLEAISRPGLLHVELSVPHIPAQFYPPPYATVPGQHDAWVYTNELPMLAELGISVEAIHAALVSDEADTGLPRFAAFAIEQLRERPDDKFWLKPTLHSVYGVLATRPDVMEFGYRRAKNLPDGCYPMGNAVIPVKVRASKGRVEAGVVNVIQRGMIEAETRMEALSLARTLSGGGLDVLSVYADSVFVRGNVPFLPEPWRVKEHVTGLKFLTATQFMSTTLTRMPGLPRNLRLNSPPEAVALLA